MINPMSSNNDDSILYLNERVNDSPSFSYAWKILKAYYDKCLDELKNIDISVAPFSDDKEKNNVFSTVKGLFENKSLLLEAANFIGVPKEKLEEIVNKKNTNISEEWIIAKINRFYNMKLKLGHSARITYVAEENLNSMFKNQDFLNKKILENATILSALLHDIGRFYQAVHYNNLYDKVMINSEDKIAGLDVDHAVAGYYYALATSMEFHKLVKENNMEAIENFITQTVAAIVVRFHQKSNSSLSHFDYNSSNDVLNDPNLLSDMYIFINDAYTDAKVMDYRIEKSIDMRHKEFIDNFVSKIKNIINSKQIDYSDASGFITDTVFLDQIYKNIQDGIVNVIDNSNEKTLDEITEEIISVMNNEIKRISSDGISKEESNDIRLEIRAALGKILNFDISESINSKFLNSHEISDSVRFILSCAMSNTMDADKIDILNQRAVGIYNQGYYINSYSVFPTENISLIEILNYYFKFDLDKNNFVIDENIIRVINNCSNPVKDALASYLREFDIFKYNPEKKCHNIKDGITIRVDGDKVFIDEGDKVTSYNSSKFSDMFNESYLDFLCNICDVELDNFKKIKENHYDIFSVNVPTDILDNNIDKSKYDKVQTYKRLLISDSLDERFMLGKDNRILCGWINDIDNHDSDHLVNGTISGLLWQLNQFLFVNMRNRHSYEFIEKYGILDDILERFKEKSFEVGLILEDYIDYSKRFVNYMINNVKGDMLTSEDLDKARREVYESYISEKNHKKTDGVKL